MIRDLFGDQWHTVAGGVLRGPDGRDYARRTTRARRADAQALVEAGTPLVLHWFGGGRLEWLDGPDAAERWAEVRRHVTTQEIRPAPGDPVRWHAGRWESPDGSSVVLLTGRC